MLEIDKIKSKLYEKCLEYIDLRIQSAKSAMDVAQEAANSDTKSSAGDKYETTRAMMQIEKDLSARRLSEALQIKAELEKIKINVISISVQPGSLVFTSDNIYFISISAGKINIDNQVYFAISAESPIGIALLRKKMGEEINFNNKIIFIKSII